MRAFSLVHQGSTAKEALRSAVMLLQKAHIESASLDARILLEHVLGVSRERLLLSFDDAMTSKEEAAYRDIIARRAQRQPVAQLIGRREFWGRVFKVTGDTLDPRPDSETLIESVLSRMSDRSKPLSILDLGTGTGCLLLTLLMEFPHATGMGVDVSDAALAVARENAKAHGLGLRARFMKSNWYEQVDGRFDMVISNPPYIPTKDIAELAPEVAHFEPRLALDGGADGLDAYRAILKDLPLAPGGLAVFEIGAGQQAAMEKLLAGHGLQLEAIKQDIQGIARCILAKQHY